MVSGSIGRVEEVELRTVWEHEAHAFTPWLAQNLDLLAYELDLPALRLRGEEVPVGGFSLDIEAETLDGDTVIIENQLESTDHTHLGQLLTYASGLKASVVIWIAKQMRDEHASALDWLNEHTDGSIHFFGLEIGAVRIDDSRPAPVLRVRVRPNDWDERNRRTSASNPSKTPDLATWLAAAEDSIGETAAGTAAQLITHWQSIGGSITFGSGSVFLMVGGRPVKDDVWPAALYSSGKLEVVFQHMASRPPWNEESRRRQLFDRINSIPGITPLPEGTLERRPGILLAELANADAYRSVCDILSWFHRESLVVRAPALAVEGDR